MNALHDCLLLSSASIYNFVSTDLGQSLITERAARPYHVPLPRGPLRTKQLLERWKKKVNLESAHAGHICGVGLKLRHRSWHVTNLIHMRALHSSVLNQNVVDALIDITSLYDFNLNILTVPFFLH